MPANYDRYINSGGAWEERKIAYYAKYERKCTGGVAQPRTSTSTTTPTNDSAPSLILTLCPYASPATRRFTDSTRNRAAR